MLSKYLSYFFIFFTTLMICIHAKSFEEPQHLRIARSPTQFRNLEMMTARGFGKRDNWQTRLIDRLMGFNDNKRNAVNNEPKLRFRMDNEEGLRIGRGFGKRAAFGQKEEYTRPWSSPSIKDLNDAEKLLQSIIQNQSNEPL